MMRSSRILIAALALFAAGLPASAADYPNKPIHVVVPWPPGGPTDAVARIISQEISEQLHQPVIIDNKTGAKLTFVPYRGDAPARLDLLAGNIQGIASTPDFGLIAEGKARLIGS